MTDLGSDERLTVLERNELSSSMSTVVAQFEKRFGVSFTRFVWFPGSQLLRSSAAGTGVRARNVIVAGDNDPTAGERVAELTTFANQSGLTVKDRLRYRQTIEELFRLLPVSPNGDTLVVAPRREGAIFARLLGWLGPDNYVEPEMKRIPFDGGLIVACDDSLRERTALRIDIVDGALATGSTAAAVLAICRPAAARLFCAHATAQGLATLLRFAIDNGVDLRCFVGEVSGILNDHFYAVVSDSPALVCVGDLGDTIAPLERD